jgi:hypothetical protein
MPVASAIAGSERIAKHSCGATTAGLAQLSLVEHALCPLDVKRFWVPELHRPRSELSHRRTEFIPFVPLETE